MKKSARTILLSLIVIMSFGFASALTACQNTHSHKFTPIVGYPPPLVRKQGEKFIISARAVTKSLRMRTEKTKQPCKR